MKMTERDKKLLIGLGIFIFVVVYVKFLFLPKILDIKALNEEIGTLNNNYAINSAYKNKAENIDSDIKILSAKLTDLRAVYPPKINISELIITIKNLSKDSNLEFKSISFEEYKPVGNGESSNSSTTTDTENNSDAEGEDALASEEQQVSISDADSESQAKENNAVINKIRNYFYLWGLKSQGNIKNDNLGIPDGKPYSLSVKVEAEGTNEQIKAFFSNLEKLEAKAYCKSSNISGPASGKSADTDNKLKLTATIVFYGIMDNNTAGYYLLPDGKWSPIPPEDNKTNLFKEYIGFDSTSNSSSFTTTNSTKNDDNDSEKSKLENYDFSIVASAFGGGLAPSVTISCKNPKDSSIYSKPVAYGDNNDTENVEIFVEKKDGKYYCKFKTDHDSYPDNDYSQTFEFVPTGKDLRLVILSTKRNSNNDKAGLNLNIINNTDRTFNYYIKNYDDENPPRVKIGKTVGSVRNEK